MIPGTFDGRQTLRRQTIVTLVALALAVQSLPDDPIARLMLEMESRPWTPPETTIPTEYVEAAKFAFSHGLADPTGGTLRRVTMRRQRYLGGEQIFESVGWVLPGLYSGHRVAVRFDGLVEPVSVVGARVTVSELMSEGPSQGTFRGFGDNTDLSQSNTVIPLLLRAGMIEDAELLFEQRFKGRPLQDAKQFLTSIVLNTHSARAKIAHIESDDLASFRHASVVSRHLPHYVSLIDPSTLKSWNEFDNSPIDNLEHTIVLLYDSRRRLVSHPMTRPSSEDIEDMVRMKRVRTLIDALELASAFQRSSPGGVSMTDDPIVMALVRIGEEAVDELLDTYERDTRLTRSSTTNRMSWQPDRILTVKDAAFAALGAILQYPGIATAPDGKPSATELRNYWSLFRDVPLIERRYAELADDVAHPRQWLAAAKHIVERTNVSRLGGWVRVASTPEAESPAMKGEPLRDGRTPTVSELISRRAIQLRGTDDFASSRSFFALGDAITMVRYLLEWDPHESLGALRALSERILAVEGKGDFPKHQLFGLVPGMSLLTVARLRLGDTRAIGDYVSLMRLVEREKGWLEHESYFAPLILYPEFQQFQLLAQELFSNPASQWHPRHNWMGLGRSEFCSPLLTNAAYRDAVLSLLDDHSVIGSVSFAGQGYKYDFGENNGSGGAGIDALEAKAIAVPDGAAGELTTSDAVAFGLSRFIGAPRFSPLWSVDKKSKARIELAAFIRENADRLETLRPESGFREREPWITREPFKK